MQKKGESAIIANLILFVAVMGMAAAAVMVFKNNIESNTNAAVEENARTTSILRTDFSIDAASYSAGTVYVYVKNIGKENFDPNDMDIYLDGIRIPRNNANRTVSVAADTDLINTGIWDYGESLEFNVFQTYTIPETHTVSVYTANGVKAESSFSS